MYNFDPKKEIKQAQVPETITLDEVVGFRAGYGVAFATTLDAISKISNIEPDSDLTLADIVYDCAGIIKDTADEEEMEDGEEEEFEEVEVEVEEDSISYILDSIMDFASAIGVSKTSQREMLSEAQDIAMDELQAFASTINEMTTGGMDIAKIVAVSMDSVILKEFMGEDVTLDSVASDWAFSKTKSTKSLKNPNGRMVNKPCIRTIDGVQKRGRCRYPISLFNGKYRPRKKGHNAGAYKHNLSLLKRMRKLAHSPMAEARRSKTMKLKFGKNNSQAAM